jgi:hypothetical protein
MKNNSAMAVKFTNQGDGGLDVIYGADGYIAYAD